jgi:ammonia channel protein AmtB
MVRFQRRLQTVGGRSSDRHGAVNTLLSPWSAGVLERRFRIDDPVGAIAVHGVCGV